MSSHASFVAIKKLKRKQLGTRPQRSKAINSAIIRLSVIFPLTLRNRILLSDLVVHQIDDLFILTTYLVDNAWYRKEKLDNDHS